MKKEWSMGIMITLFRNGVRIVIRPVEQSPKLRNMTSLYLVSDDQVLCLYRVGSRVADRMYIGSAGGHFEK